MMRVMSKSFGVYTAATPARWSSATSCSGMMPPTTTGAVTPSLRSASMTAGISSRWEPDRIDRPITCTPSCSAEAAIWAGVMRIPSYTTSMPESRARTAICSAPFECPSRPGLPTRIFGRRPSFSCRRETSMRSSLSSPSAGAAAASPTPVGAR